MDSVQERDTSAWAVIHVHEGSEQAVVDEFGEHFNKSRYAAFVPMKVKCVARGGQVIARSSLICFPGYVFLRILTSKEQFLKEVYPLLGAVKNTYRFVNYGLDKKDVIMHDDEKEYLVKLFNDDYRMDSSVGFMENGRVRILSGALKNVEDSIIKVFRNKRLAVIRVPFMGDFRDISMSLEVVGNIGA